MNYHFFKIYILLRLPLISTDEWIELIFCLLTSWGIPIWNLGLHRPYSDLHVRKCGSLLPKHSKKLIFSSILDFEDPRIWPNHVESPLKWWLNHMISCLHFNFELGCEGLLTSHTSASISGADASSSCLGWWFRLARWQQTIPSRFFWWFIGAKNTPTGMICKMNPQCLLSGFGVLGLPRHAFAETSEPSKLSPLSIGYDRRL